MMDLLNDKKTVLVTNYNGKPGQYGIFGTAENGGKIFSPLQSGQ